MTRSQQDLRQIERHCRREAICSLHLDVEAHCRQSETSVGRIMPLGLENSKRPGTAMQVRMHGGGHDLPLGFSILSYELAVGLLHARLNFGFLYDLRTSTSPKTRRADDRDFSASQ
jgi:hypothetical protein